MTDPSNLKNYCPEDEMSTINTLREALLRNKISTAAVLTAVSHSQMGLLLMFVFKVNVGHIQHLCTTQSVSHLLFRTPFLFKDLLTWWFEFSNYVVCDNSFMCAEVQCYTEAEHFKASNYVLAQIFCDEKSQCGRENSSFLSSYSQSEHLSIYTKWLHQESGSLAGLPGSYRRAGSRVQCAAHVVLGAALSPVCFVAWPPDVLTAGQPFSLQSHMLLCRTLCFS